MSESTEFARSFREQWNADYEAKRLAKKDNADLDAITEAIEQRVEADQHLRVVVRKAKANGHSWSTIGKTLGMTRQAARERFGP